jgi:hypothetical protein
VLEDENGRTQIRIERDRKREHEQNLNSGTEKIIYA